MITIPPPLSIVKVEVPDDAAIAAAAVAAAINDNVPSIANMPGAAPAITNATAAIDPALDKTTTSPTSSAAKKRSVQDTSDTASKRARLDTNPNRVANAYEQDEDRKAIVEACLNGNFDLFEQMDEGYKEVIDEMRTDYSGERRSLEKQNEVLRTNHQQCDDLQEKNNILEKEIASHERQISLIFDLWRLSLLGTLIRVKRLKEHNDRS